MHEAGVSIIFQDIDGCLNPADGEHFSVIPGEALSESQCTTLQAINHAVERAPIEHFILNTGRPWSLVQSICEHLTTPKARFVLLEHACVLYDRKTQSYLDCVQLAKDCKLDELANRYTQVATIHQLIDWYHQKGQSLLEAHYQRPLPALEKKGNLSICIPESVHGDELLERIELLAREQLVLAKLQDFQFLRSDRYIDILPGIDKLDGIHLLCAHLGTDLDHALAVGDYLNDLNVFKDFKRVLCPANAHPKIQALTRAKERYGHVSEKPYGLALIEFLESYQRSYLQNQSHR